MCTCIAIAKWTTLWNGRMRRQVLSVGVIFFGEASHGCAIGEHRSTGAQEVKRLLIYNKRNVLSWTKSETGVQLFFRLHPVFFSFAFLFPQAEPYFLPPRSSSSHVSPSKKQARFTHKYICYASFHSLRMLPFLRPLLLSSAPNPHPCLLLLPPPPTPCAHRSALAQVVARQQRRHDELAQKIPSALGA